MLVLFVFIAVLPYLCASSQNYLSSLTLSSETQATESDITVFVNATFQDSVGQISWCIGSVDDVVGFAVANSPIILINYIADSPYRSRINISAQGDNYTIQSQILITSVKKNENLEICVLHGAFDNPVWTKLNVTDCPSVLPHGVHITATYFTFGSSGIFACPSNGELFYSNGTLVASSSAQTQCLADATWSQQENLECWNAPTVKLLPDNISGNEGEIIPLSCQASGGFPSPYLYEFFLPGSATAEPSSNISITLKREWNKQEIYCEAVSNYTALNDEGNSSSKKINVKYRPQYVSASVVAQTNDQLINSFGDLYLNSAQNLNASCSTDSNPPATCEWLYCSSACINVSSKCEDNFVVAISGNLSCSAGNLVGSELSANISLHVVPLNRSVIIRNTTGLAPLNISKVCGTIITLHCSIRFDDVLNTSYSWNIQNFNGSSKVDSRSIEVNLTREDTGNYTCNTADPFMNYSETVSIYVLYDPYSNHQPIDCRFFVNHSSSCEVEFYSNPPTDVYNLTKDGKNTTNDATNPLQSHADGLHTFTFSKNKVLQSDAGVYKLSVQSGLNPGNVDKHLVVNFTVVVTVEQSPAQQTNIALIAGASAAGAVILILVVVLLVIVLKRRKHAQKEVQNNPIYGSPEDVMINGSHELHQTTGGEKEEVVNPLYATSSTQPDKIEEAYGAVKKEKKKKKASGKNGKEEKVNPLYAASGSQDVIEEAYGQVAREGNAAQEESRKSDAPTPAAASAAAMANPQDVYAPVDFSKKANRRGKGEASGMVAGPSSSNDVEAASEVHGKKKGKSQKAAAPVAADAAVGGPADIYAAPDMSKKANRKANGKNQEAAAAVPAPVPFPAAAPVAANADAAVGGPADIYAAPDMSKKANRKANGASSEASSSQEKPSKPKKPKKPKKGSDAARANPPRNDDDDDNTGNGLLHGSSSTERPENVYHVS